MKNNFFKRKKIHIKGQKIFLILYEFNLGFDSGIGVQSAHATKEGRNKALKRLEQEDTFFNFIETEIEIED